MGSLTLKIDPQVLRPVEVLHGIDLEVTDGEFVIFVGPSGCGKSTLLRIIAGLEDVERRRSPDRRREWSTTPPAKRGIAMVFQTYALYPHLTVRDNMGLGLKQAGTPKDEIENAWRRRSRCCRWRTISSAGRRSFRAASASASPSAAPSCANPKLFLFDEPLSNLDAALRVNTRLEIARLHRELKATMIYVTHDQVEAMTLADKIVVMNAGRIEQIGSPMELYNNPGQPLRRRLHRLAADELHRGGERSGAPAPRPSACGPSTSSSSRRAATGRARWCTPSTWAPTPTSTSTREGRHVTARLFGEHSYDADDVLDLRPDPQRTYRFDAEGNVL